MMYLKKDNLVIIGTNDGDFCVFDIETCDYKIIKGTHTSSINDMVLLDDGTFVSCSNDGLINLNKIVFKQERILKLIFNYFLSLKIILLNFKV